MTLNIASSGPPKIRKNASKKNKKSWRKNVDMTEVEDFLGNLHLRLVMLKVLFGGFFKSDIFLRSFILH